MKTLCKTIFLILLVAAACGGKPAAKPSDTPSVPLQGKPSARPAWTVSIGSSGGFTGGGSEHTIRSNGQIVQGQWDEASSPRKEQIIGKKLSATDLDKLHKLLIDPELAALKLNVPGNMTYFLTFKQGVKTWSYRWSNGSPPPPLQRAYQAVRAALGQTGDGPGS